MVLYRLERVPSRRFAGLNPTGETLAKHADRAEFHRAREFIAAARARTFGLRAHPNRPSVATSADSNTTRAPSGAKSAGTAPGKLLSRCTANPVSRTTTALNHVSEQNSRYFRRWEGSRLIAVRPRLTRPCKT